MNPKIKRFIDEYLIDYNGAEAARRAGYKTTSARQQAYALLRRPDVIKAIESHYAAQRQHAGMQADEIITRLSQLARGGSGEWQQLRALNMLMRHLGMFASTRAPAAPPEPSLLELLQAMPSVQAPPEPPAPEPPAHPPADHDDDQGYPEPNHYPEGPEDPEDPEDPDPKPQPPRKREPVDINELIAANNAARARIRYDHQRRHRFDDP